MFVAEQFGDLVVQTAPLVPQAPFHGHPVVAAVEEIVLYDAVPGGGGLLPILP